MSATLILLFQIPSEEITRETKSRNRNSEMPKNNHHVHVGSDTNQKDKERKVPKGPEGDKENKIVSNREESKSNFVVSSNEEIKGTKTESSNARKNTSKIDEGNGVAKTNAGRSIVESGTEKPKGLYSFAILWKLQ